MRTRRPLLALAAMAGFVALAVVLLWSDSAGNLPEVGGSLVTDVGRRAEAALGLNLLDRSDIPVAFDQLGHMGLWFVGMMLFGWVGRDHVPPMVTAVLVGAASLVSELGQSWASTARDTSFADAIANLVGVAFGLVVLTMVLSVRLVFAHIGRRSRPDN